MDLYLSNWKEQFRQDYYAYAPWSSNYLGNRKKTIIRWTIQMTFMINQDKLGLQIELSKVWFDMERANIWQHMKQSLLHYMQMGIISTPLSLPCCSVCLLTVKFTSALSYIYGIFCIRCHQYSNAKISDVTDILSGIVEHLVKSYYESGDLVFIGK